MVVAISAVLGIIAGFVLGMELNSQVREDIAALHRLCQRIEGAILNK